MTIFINLANQLITEAIYQLLVASGYHNVILSRNLPSKGVVPPDALLVDTAALQQDFHSPYPSAKVLLMDTGMEPEELRSTLLSYRMHGILSPDTGHHVLKKALNAITQGGSGSTMSRSRLMALALSGRAAAA